MIIKNHINFIFFEIKIIPANMLAINKRGERMVSKKWVSKPMEPNKINNWVIKKDSFRYLKADLYMYKKTVNKYKLTVVKLFKYYILFKLLNTSFEYSLAVLITLLGSIICEVTTPINCFPSGSSKLYINVSKIYDLETLVVVELGT